MDTFLVIVNYLMFLGLLPISILWLRKAWKVGIKKDMSYVALKRAESPKHPEKYAVATIILNLLAGFGLLVLFVFVLLTGMESYYSTWTAIAGSTIWMKFIVEFIISRQAHLKIKKNKF